MDTPTSQINFMPRRGLRVRHEAGQLARLVFDAVHAMPKGTRGDLADQLRRAATSVHANLAEGEGRASVAERVQFFRVAWASLREVEAHLALAHTLGLLTPANAPALRTSCRQVGRLLHALLRATTRF